MIHVTCRLTVKNWDQLQNPTLGNRVWATFFTAREWGTYRAPLATRASTLSASICRALLNICIASVSRLCLRWSTPAATLGTHTRAHTDHTVRGWTVILALQPFTEQVEPHPSALCWAFAAEHRHLQEISIHRWWYCNGTVNVDLYSVIITKVSNALNTLVSGEKRGFQAPSKGLIVLLCKEVVRQGVPDHGAVHSECSASNSG